MKVTEARAAREARELDIPELSSRETLARLLVRTGSALLEGWSDRRRWRILLAWPEEIVSLPWSRAGEWLDALDRIDCDGTPAPALEEFPFAGGWIGFVTYDAGAQFEGAAPYDREPREPAVWFARHERALLVDESGHVFLVCDADDREEITRDLRNLLSSTIASHAEMKRPALAFPVIGDSQGAGLYARRVTAIRDAIANGDVYQVNLTRCYSVKDHVDATALYLHLTGDDPPRCSALIRGDGWWIASASPEVFLKFDRRSGVAESRPIKGTVRRHGDDAGEIANLLASEKDASEHLMIVDLVRNDLGKIAPSGGVSVPEYRQIRTLEHVHHLESTVRGERLHHATLRHLFTALFPGGSITGAPKRAAVQYIRTFEPVPRGVYTGAIGFVDFRGHSEWSVAIRTAVVGDDGVRYHAGGGIVWDSDPSTEDQESVAKSVAFLDFFGDSR